MRRLGLILFFLAWPALSPAETRFALIVGHNFGFLREVPLRWAESDADRVQEVLTGIGDVATSRSTLLLSPRRQKFNETLLQMQGRLAEARLRGEATTLLFYFSGHADRDALHFFDEEVLLESLKRQLAGMGATTALMIVDACRNDRAPRVVDKGALRAPAFDWPLNEPAQPEGFVYLASAAQGEVAQESDEIQGSLFTHHLLAGIRGSADLDNDGIVTLEELYMYGYSRTLQDTHGQTTAVQHSERELKLTGRGTLVISTLRDAESQVEFALQLKGHLLVVDDASDRVITEVHWPGARPLRLALPAGRYRVQVRTDREIRVGLLNLRQGANRVRLEDLAVQETYAVLVKGSGYDPYPQMLFGGVELGRSHFDGFGALPYFQAQWAYRLQPAWRLSVIGNLGQSSTKNQVYRYSQWETALLFALDRVESQRWWAWTAGLRVGAALVSQSGTRRDVERLKQVGLSGAPVNTDSLGPQLGLALGVELFPYSRLGLRLEGSAQQWWLHSSEGLFSRFGAMGAVSTMMRF